MCAVDQRKMKMNFVTNHFLDIEGLNTKAGRSKNSEVISLNFTYEDGEKAEVTVEQFEKEDELTIARIRLVAGNYIDTKESAMDSYHIIHGIESTIKKHKEFLIEQSYSKSKAPKVMESVCEYFREANSSFRVSHTDNYEVVKVNMNYAEDMNGTLIIYVQGNFDDGDEYVCVRYCKGSFTDMTTSLLDKNDIIESYVDIIKKNTDIAMNVNESSTNREQGVNVTMNISGWYKPKSVSKESPNDNKIFDDITEGCRFLTLMCMNYSEWSPATTLFKGAYMTIENTLLGVDVSLSLMHDGSVQRTASNGTPSMGFLTNQQYEEAIKNISMTVS